MGNERHLRRKLTLRAHGEQVVFVKEKQERIEHVWMKAFLWALYLPEYPDLTVEVKVGDKYKPDVVAMDERERDPVFWGEAGEVSRDKIEALVERYPRTHFAMAKWATSLDPFAEMIAEGADEQVRRAPFDLIAFPPDAAERFIDERGHVALRHEDVEWRRLGSTDQHVL
jgi:hypothetical protein